MTAAIEQNRTALGIELGSTRIKACLIDADTAEVLATGSHTWENRFEDGRWTYPLDEVWAGLQSAYAALIDETEGRHGIRPSSFGAIGISAMMHGYLAFDAAGKLLVPFRTWRNTSTGAAAAELTQVLGVNIPQRWSVAHLHQAVLDAEPHVGDIASINTLAGYVHERLTGRRVLGVGDASGMFPIDSTAVDYDAALLEKYRAHTRTDLAAILPEVLAAGRDAGALTLAGAALLDPTGALLPGIPLCPPEGDAGTGMVATNSVAPLTGNVSAGTSIFAMVVLEKPLPSVHEELDLVTTPAGAPVAMVHCNNGASELGAWAGLFHRFSVASGQYIDADAVFATLFDEALQGDADAGGLLAYNHLAGEPVVGLSQGRPLFVRTPEASFTLANVMRAQIYGVFGTLALGMRILDDDGVRIERMFAHGGLFRTAGVAQRFLAAALDTPVVVGELAAEGGAWGIAVLAAYLGHAEKHADRDLSAYLADTVFARASVVTADPDPADVAGFSSYLSRYRDGLAIEAAAITALPTKDAS